MWNLKLFCAKIEIKKQGLNTRTATDVERGKLIARLYIETKICTRGLVEEEVVN
jgi:hypothetical protein